MLKKINFKLHIHNEAKIEINQPALFLIIKNNLAIEEIYSPIEIDLTICGEDRIRELNKKYLSHDYITDILSFPVVDKKELKNLDNDSIILLGEIVICKEVTGKQALEKNHTFIQEFNFLFEHGLKHLLGHHHN